MIKKNIIKKCFIAIIAFNFSLFVGEFAVRYKYKAFPFKQEIAWANVDEKDKVLRWKPSPNENTNRLGLNNREIQEKEEQYRILFLGDSLLWGGVTSSGKQYTEIIEENLNNHLTRKIETINSGIYGYTTYQELEFLKIHGLDMKPDCIILSFCFNDLYYKYLHRPTKKNKLDIGPIARLERFDRNSFPRLISNSYLAHALVQLKDNYSAFPFEKKADFFLAWKDYGWNKEKDVLLAMQEITVSNNILFAIVALPISDQVNDKYLSLNKEHVLYPQYKLQEICNNNSIPYLDLHDDIYNNNGTQLYKDYLHLKPKGNDIVAAKITDFLMSLLDE